MTASTHDLTVGAELPAFSRSPGLHHWNRFAAVNDEFVDIHMSDLAGQTAGYSGAIGMGNLLWAYLHNVVEEWLDGSGQILRLECQFRSPNLRDTEVTSRGRVKEVREGAASIEVDLDVWVEDADGKTLVPGEATVVLSNPSERGQL
jgi:MaoC like domain